MCKRTLDAHDAHVQTESDSRETVKELKPFSSAVADAVGVTEYFTGRLSAAPARTSGNREIASGCRDIARCR